jgi:nicotinate-nucleotide pyrophosphorylase (carboxylating)
MNKLLVSAAIHAALSEDLGRAGDITSNATIPAQAQAQAVLAARSAGVLAGLELAVESFQVLDSALKIELFKNDGERLDKGDIIAKISGNARAILAAERVALNYLGHLSGIASTTARLVDAIAHTRAKITCTRKTIPGLRAFEKHAVKCGGGSNHRFGLDDAILIKDNHIAVAGGIIPALRAAKTYAGHLVKIEIEVDTLNQLEDVLREGADCVLLDNMDNTTLLEAVRRIDDRLVCEASGNIRLETVANVAETGVNLIAVGWITHSAPTLDIGLDIEV